MSKQSAGLLLYRFRDDDELEVLLIHPGGPLWKNKDLGAWSIPKGEFLPGQDPLETALREFEEETGTRVAGDILILKPVRQAGGKLVHAFAMEGDFDPATLVSNTFEVVRRDGSKQQIPEVDRAEWCDPETARKKLNPAQAAFIDELVQKLG